MGQWTITIHGHGGHDNNSETDIERLLGKFLGSLSASGQDVEVGASLTIGSRREVAVYAGTDPGTGNQPPDPPPVVPTEKPKPGLFFPQTYPGSFPGFDTLALPPHNYPRGASAAAKTGRGGVSWGVLNPNDPPSAKPDGFEFIAGKVGE